MKKALLTLLAFLFAAPAHAESAYERVLKTNTLRCGYIVYPPETVKDVNTGALSGIMVEKMEALGKVLNLKVEWTEEVAFANMYEGLQSGRYDALCSGLLEKPERARVVLFSIPSNFGVTHAFVRADENRFNKGFGPLNDPLVKISTIDGEIGQSIATEMFPQAQQYALAQMNDNSMVLEAVATGKADVAFLHKSSAKIYTENNPGKIKLLSEEPIRAYASPPLAFHPDEIKLKHLCDSGIRTLLLNGTIEKIIRKYDPSLESYSLVAKPYEVIN
ncbi:MAG: transporter substrate-binding domain-containing protein [Alphaproteobacteria bacterium]|nr:transporter substrate-binding domain-containing protein [Alphaproteobacteria bacterium]